MSNITRPVATAATTITAVDINKDRTDLVVNAGDYATTTGSSNAYALTLDSAFVLAAGTVVKAQASFANTGAPTLEVTPSGGSTTGAKAIVNSAGSPLNPGDIPSGAIFTVIYDGTNYQMQSSQRIPEWVDEGSLVWAASAADQTLTLNNSGRNIYKVIFSFTNVGSSAFTLNMQMNGDSGSHYAYIYRNTTTFTSQTGKTSIEILNTSQTACGGELLIPGKIVGSGSENLTVGAQISTIPAGDALQCGEWLPATSGGVSLSSLKFLVNGAAVTGNVHVYSLNL